MTDFSPREIVSELDRFIVGQADAKRAVSIALRNRWRRQPLAEGLREEVLPKNILMIGPSGGGQSNLRALFSSGSKPRNSPRSAMSAAMSNRSSAISSKSPLRKPASEDA